MMAATNDEPPRNTIHWVRCTLASIIVLAVAAYVGAMPGGGITSERRLDTNSILLIALATGIVLLTVNPSWTEGLTSITLGSFKAEFAQIRLKQELQQRQVDGISAVLALLLTDEEQKQLLQLSRGETSGYRGSHDLRTRLRKLRDMRLLQMTKDSTGNNKTIGSMKDETVVDLTDFLALTELGKRISSELERIVADKSRIKQREAPDIPDKN